MATVINVRGSTVNNKPNAGKQYEELTGKPVPHGMVAAHVRVQGEGKRQFLVPATPAQNHHSNTKPYKVRHKPVPING
ncbi:MAG: hypothetical protein FWG87_09370 [Defluviitaleaceae bacterium]|nr:hypothetical protein [Defluviitaleaceae bacterium]